MFPTLCGESESPAGLAGTTAQVRHPLGVGNKESKHLVLATPALESHRCSTKSGLTLEAQAPSSSHQELVLANEDGCTAGWQPWCLWITGATGVHWMQQS